MRRPSTRLALALIAGCVLAACEGVGDRGDSLEAELGAVLRAALADDGAADEAVARWMLSREELAAIAVPAYRDLGAAANDAFAARAPELAASLAAMARVGGTLEVKTHYAEDASLSAEQSRLRWVTPVGQPGKVAFLVGRDGRPAPLDTVFVRVNGRWRILLGVDDAARDLVLARVADVPGCAARVRTHWSPTCVRGPCLDALYQVATAALVDNRGSFARACGALESAR